MLSLPREIGKHPEDGEPIVANFGRFGPYVSHNKQYASLDSPDEVFTVGINRAVTLLAEKKAKSRAPRGPEALRELGAMPDGGATVKVMRGRYGPYVSDGSTNATLPKENDPLTVTLEQAIALIVEREAAGGGKKKKPKKKAAKAKAEPKVKAEPKTKAAPKAKSAPKAKAKPKAKPEEVEG
jgi:DNA topoisomerase-1